MRCCVSQPIRFLLELSLIAQFEERVHCFLFRSVFSEKLSLIEHRLAVVDRACQVRRLMRTLFNGLLSSSPTITCSHSLCLLCISLSSSSSPSPPLPPLLFSSLPSSPSPSSPSPSSPSLLSLPPPLPPPSSPSPPSLHLSVFVPESRGGCGPRSHPGPG